MNKKQKSLGFTLIESLVVVTMMMVIVAAAVGSYSAANKKNRDNKRMADLDRIRMALEMYRQNSATGIYPTTANVVNDLVPNFLDSWPVGPKGVADVYVYTSPIGTNSYRYTLSTTLEITGATYSVSNP